MRRYFVLTTLSAGLAMTGCSGNTPSVPTPSSGLPSRPVVVKSGEPARPAPSENIGVEEGKTAPEIDGVDLDGKRFKLSDYRGKVVLLDFWGNW
jgi:hypothetical protein